MKNQQVELESREGNDRDMENQDTIIYHHYSCLSNQKCPELPICIY